MHRLILFLVPVCCVTALAAQGPAPAGLPRNATVVRVNSWSGTRDSVSGLTTLAPSNDSISLPKAFSASDAKKGSHWRTGMLIGGGVGLFLAYAFSNFDLEPDDRSFGQKLSGWVIVVAVFSMAGGLIGSLFPRGS